MQPTKTNGALPGSSLSHLQGSTLGVKRGQDLLAPSSSIAIC